MDLKEVMERQEELHPDLSSCLVEESLGTCIKHPLVIGLFYHPGMNAFYNEQYKAKLKYVKDSVEKKAWSSYLWIHERPYRIEKFAEIQGKLSDKEYWSLFGELWSDCENLWQYRIYINAIINSDRAGREEMMNEDEKLFLSKLPDEFTIYRGHQHKNRSGYSWTLSYWQAKWFANRFQQKRQGVAKAIVNKKDVIAVLLGRNEYEIIVSPSHLKIKKETNKMDRPTWMESLKEELENTFSNGLGKRNSHYSVHGPWHWEKVEENALRLANLTHEADKLVVQLFALIHDSKRENENDDPKHGIRAAKHAQELFDQGKLPIDKEQLSVLMEACKYHNDGKTTNDPTIGVCWDADRLDLPRVGIIPNPDLMSTKAGKDSIWKV